ncbi:MAG TPA: fumarylacetoacetate hydrolase family protein [Methylomirabilota bacterium]|jgi:2-keto-4-pentenoate hydratase/2-oxohepta-3-ene-1,7-dioic acid hydratase in catechol pathway|nr:fumarylacetoacetate hydrolase family protein [Methylomirabilota bacterium]
MQLVTYLAGRTPRLGAVWHDTVLDLRNLSADMAAQRQARPAPESLLPRTVLELIDGGPPTWGRAHEVWDYGRALVDRLDPADLRRRGVARALSRVRLGAPIPRPRKNIFCMGRNYAEHAAERGAAPPERPVFFTKPPTAVIGPGASIVHHAVTQALDYEVELAVVLGRAGRDLVPEDALSHVFGYTVLNDVTARDLQKTHQQWFKGKSLDTFCPMGPVLVTADEIPDPQALGIRLRVNGETRQEATTRQMIFDVSALLAALSAGMTLEPGDILATGTPSGVGAATGAYLKVGDFVEAEIDGIGCLPNRVVAADAS